MNSVQLLFSTGSDRADDILRGVIGIWECVFPRRVRGYYLLGSYNNGSADFTSDLDLTVLFRNRYLDDAETDKAQCLCEYLEAMNSSIYVDMGYLSEESLQQADRVSVALRLKRSSVLLYGADTRDAIRAVPDERYVRDTVHIAYYSSKSARPHPDVLCFPLDFPGPSAEFYGYDAWPLPDPKTGWQPGLKMLVAIVGRIATALIALRTAQYVGSKQECITLYRAGINDAWAELVEQVYEYCKVQWSYRVPTRKAERRKLRTLCEQTLAFENHFFSLYRAFLLDELRSGCHERRARAVERLGQIRYPEAEVTEALSRLARSDAFEDVRQAAEAAICHLQAACL